MKKGSFGLAALAVLGVGAVVLLSESKSAQASPAKSAAPPWWPAGVDFPQTAPAWWPAGMAWPPDPSSPPPAIPPGAQPPLPPGSNNSIPPPGDIPLPSGVVPGVPNVPGLPGYNPSMPTGPSPGQPMPTCQLDPNLPPDVRARVQSILSDYRPISPQDLMDLASQLDPSLYPMTIGCLQQRAVYGQPIFAG